MSHAGQRDNHLSPAAVSSRLGATIREAGTANVLARRLLWYRELRGWTQVNLAARAGVSRSAVNDAESGQTQITIRTLQLLATALRTNPAVLFGYMDPSEADLLADQARRRI